MKDLLQLLAFATIAFSQAQAASHTPAPGSPERKAICDAVRARVLANAMKKPPKPIVFKIDFLRVENGFAWFEGTPRLQDGSYVPDGYIADVDYIMVLKQDSGGWKVMQDLSRGDVPSEQEGLELRKQLKEVPDGIIPDSWRKILKR